MFLESVLPRRAGLTMKVLDLVRFTKVDPSAEHIVQVASDTREDYGEKNGPTLTAVPEEFKIFYFGFKKNKK